MLALILWMRINKAVSKWNKKAYECGGLHIKNRESGSKCQYLTEETFWEIKIKTKLPIMVEPLKGFRPIIKLVLCVGILFAVCRRRGSHIFAEFAMKIIYVGIADFLGNLVHLQAFFEK